MSRHDTVGAGLSREVFVALCAIGWADGALDREEAEGILRAAAEAGMKDEDLRHIEEATRAPQALEALDPKMLTRVERMFVYATAVWLARLDGHVDPGERAALRRLGDLLGLSDGVRTHASAGALEVAQLPTGDRPARYDLARLRERLDARLKTIRDDD
ncbi:MAG: TerB family tellurite resistance protein [Deltaproteobacteria bacterium]|nr:TerB family tellurite resistance protein [Deltaproteobacteria bacterium]